MISASYVQYSTIAARAVRQALRGDAKEAGVKRGKISSARESKMRDLIILIAEIVSVKFQKWENGKPLGKKEWLF